MAEHTESAEGRGENSGAVYVTGEIDQRTITRQYPNTYTIEGACKQWVTEHTPEGRMGEFPVVVRKDGGSWPYVVQKRPELVVHKLRGE